MLMEPVHTAEMLRGFDSRRLHLLGQPVSPATGLS
jgi:hypothetical protein